MEYIFPTRLLIQSDRQAFSYADPADRNPSRRNEFINHFEPFFKVKTEKLPDSFRIKQKRHGAGHPAFSGETFGTIRDH